MGVEGSARGGAVRARAQAARSVTVARRGYAQSAKECM
jgi:hypothetical protein